VAATAAAAAARQYRARASATAPAALRGELNRQLGRGGPGASAFVYDATAHRILISRHANEMHPPASVEKLYTSTTALLRMGPEARLATQVLGTGELSEGVWHGNLYLKGGGDPTFGSRGFIVRWYGGRGASISTLVHKLVKVDGIRRVTGDIEGDESYFDSLRGEPSSGYAFDPWLGGRLSALAFNRGYVGSLSGEHAPAAYSALRLLDGLRRAGVRVEGESGAATTPPRAKTLAVVRSPRLSELLHLMLPPSDNYFAETLIKDLGARFGGAGTTSAGAAVVKATLAKLHIRPQVVDGSGLSRSDLTSPVQVVRLLRETAGSRDGQALRSALAIPGLGTLEERMRGTAAEGRCQAKTGTLEGVSNIAGYCNAIDGHLLEFAFFDDGIELDKAHAIQDAMTIALASY